MCNLSDGIEMRGIIKGKTEANVNNIMAVMDTFKISLEEAIRALKIPTSDIDLYKKEVEEKLKELAKA